jgi:large subunit ribosomal protein L33
VFSIRRGLTISASDVSTERTGCTLSRRGGNIFLELIFRRDDKGRRSKFERFWSTSMREIITLQCPECKERNYSTTKNKRTTTGRLEFSKFCKRCRKHTAHKETK